MVAAHWNACGFLARRFAEDESDTENQKTPDLQVTAPGRWFFLCEVKSIDSRSDEGGILHKTIANNLAKDIRKAAKQFRAVNSQRLVPNVLAWVSHSYRYEIQRLIELLEGEIRFSNGVPVADLRAIRNGIVAPDLPEIDLHIWFRRDDPPSFFMVRTEPLFDSLLDEIVMRCRRPVAA